MTIARSTPWRPLLAATAMLVLAGCASMSPQECRTADWYERGLRDGQDGQSRAYLDEHAKACKEVNVRPDASRWAAGWEVGIRHYCTPANGFEQGRSGRYYSRSCPPNLEPGFLDRYRSGKAIYDAERRVDDLDNRIRDRERRLERSKDDRERDRLRSEIRDLDRDLRRARDDLYSAERRARLY